MQCLGRECQISSGKVIEDQPEMLFAVLRSPAHIFTYIGTEEKLLYDRQYDYNTIAIVNKCLSML